MGLLGTLVKSSIDLSQKLQGDSVPAVAEQEEQLRQLLEKAGDTAFGKYYGFSSMLKSKDIVAAFRKEVPLHTYESIHSRWWKRQQRLPDITWPGRPKFFARSSGTTGKSSKKIPITDDFLQSMRQVGRSMIAVLPEFDFPEHLFESEILMLSSSANLDENKRGQQEGEISGINVSNFPGWYDLFYRPGKEIAVIDDWDERVARIVKEAPNWNIGAIAGIPSWVLLMLQEIVKGHRLKHIHEIWPNLTVYASGGVAFDTYREDFQKLFSSEVTIMDTYLASEGFIAYTARPETMAMRLATSHGYYFEFIPFDQRGVDDLGNILDDAEIHTLRDVTLDQEYVLVLSSCAGAWRYIIGDTVKFTSLEPFEIRITGRTKFYLNVVGSQLSEEKMDAAIIETAEKENCTINEYMVGAIKNQNDEYIHKWIIVTDDPVDENSFQNTLDQILKEANKNYAVARSKALKGISVSQITKDTYHGYLQKNGKKGGQVKTPKVMPAEKMKAFLEFIKG
ncbi:MAG: GH3 auxin-responsive promoter family protein [Cyclobacteriaceae bacterium]